MRRGENEMDLHITNIAATVTEIKLRALFERVALVVGVKLLSGGDAFVSFSSDDDARKALQELDGSVMAGAVLSMRIALPRRERHSSTGEQDETDSVASNE